MIERAGFKNLLEKLPKPLQHIYAFLIVMVGWVFFRADTLTAAFEYIAGMFRPSGSDLEYFNLVLNGQYWFCLAVGTLCVIPHVRLQRLTKKHAILNGIQDVSIILVFMVAICYMVGSGYSPFLYFRF